MSELLENILKDAKWKNMEFPSTPEWKNTYDEWISFISEQGQMGRFKPRICASERASSKAFAEICAAYYFHKVLNYNIVEWEPKGRNNSLGEFVVELPCKTRLFCEVKSPGWEKEYVERKLFERLKQPKYQNAEAMSYNNAPSILRVVESSYKKYDQNAMNLIIIVDDFMVPNYQDNYHGVDKALYATKLPKTHTAAVNVQCFSHCWNEVDTVWSELIRSKYINENGKILDGFDGNNYPAFCLDIDFGKNCADVKRRIFDVIRFQNYEGLFMSDNHKYLSGLASLNVQQLEEVKYFWRVFDNHKAACRLPGYFVTDTFENAFRRKRQNH